LEEGGIKPKHVYDVYLSFPGQETSLSLLFIVCQREVDFDGFLIASLAISPVVCIYALRTDHLMAICSTSVKCCK
jgi:hypothetical protein